LRAHRRVRGGTARSVGPEASSRTEIGSAPLACSAELALASDPPPPRPWAPVRPVDERRHPRPVVPQHIGGQAWGRWVGMSCDGLVITGWSALARSEHQTHKLVQALIDTDGAAGGAES
jgi:hypothetical protein